MTHRHPEACAVHFPVLDLVGNAFAACPACSLAMAHPPLLSAWSPGDPQLSLSPKYSSHQLQQKWAESSPPASEAATSGLQWRPAMHGIVLLSTPASVTIPAKGAKPSLPEVSLIITSVVLLPTWVTKLTRKPERRAWSQAGEELGVHILYLKL